MKTFNAIVKVVTALAAITGAIYILATYGDKIVEWAKNMLNIKSAAPVETTPAAAPAEAVPEEAPVAEEEAPAEEAEAVEEAVEQVEEEIPQEEVVPTEDAPVADESDFEG